VAYATRTQDDPGDVGRAADQQQSVDNEEALYAAVYGPSSPPPGIVRQWVQRTGLQDNTATEIFTITTINEAGDNDGGVYGVVVEGIVAHGIGPTLEAAVASFRAQFARALNGAASAGNNSAVVESSETAVAASTVATKGIATITMTVVETSEYVQSVKFQVDINGTTVTTADVYLMVSLTYAGFTTPPAIVSAG
jgi:hypothetical protein